MPLRVLIVEDSEDDAALLVRELRRGGCVLAYELVETAEAMAAALDGQGWDVVVSDYVMPRFSGLAALKMVKERGLDLPFIIVSGKIGEETAVEAMKAGAHDYFTKDRLARLAPAIEREMRDVAVRRERRRLEEQLLRAQRLEMAGRIAGQVAHDFGNLLTPLVAYPQLIRKQLPAGHPAIKFCEALQATARQMVALNDDLLTLGRRGRIAQEPTDLNSLVEQAVAQIVDRPSTLTLRLDLSQALPSICGSPAQLARVIANLISNAREAMRDAGILTIETLAVQSDIPFGHHTHVEAGEYVALRVTDTGCGIPPETISRIFEPFFTTKVADNRRGSGLGLTIVQAIVGDHGGYLDLESEVGRGTTFAVYLPISHEGEVAGQIVAGGNQSQASRGEASDRSTLIPGGALS